jgi:hypothetical protein
MRASASFTRYGVQQLRPNGNSPTPRGWRCTEATGWQSTTLKLSSPDAPTCKSFCAQAAYGQPCPTSGYWTDYMYSLRRNAPRREARVALALILVFFFIAGTLGGWAVGDTLVRKGKSTT